MRGESECSTGQPRMPTSRVVPVIGVTAGVSRRPLCYLIGSRPDAASCLIWVSEYGPVSRSVNVFTLLPTQPASPTLDVEQALKPLSGGLMTPAGVRRAAGYFARRYRADAFGRQAVPLANAVHVVPATVRGTPAARATDAGSSHFAYGPLSW